MTVKELKEKLNKFDDNLIVMIPNQDWYLGSTPIWHVPATNVAQGVNETDGCVFIGYTDEE